MTQKTSHRSKQVSMQLTHASCWQRWECRRLSPRGWSRTTSPTSESRTNAQAATASRFFLIRSTCLHQRITDGELSVFHIPDPENPSDFLTKFIGAAKTEASVAYASGKPLEKA